MVDLNYYDLIIIEFVFIFIPSKAPSSANSVLAVNETETEKEDVQPIQEEIANQIRKKMEKMKMNRDLEHIEVILSNKKNGNVLK